MSTLYLPLSSYPRIDYFNVVFNIYFLLRISKSIQKFSQTKWILVSIVSDLLAMAEPVTVPFIFLAFFYIAYLTLHSLKNILRNVRCSVCLCGHYRATESS
jgi:hypothetical protein